MPPSRPEVARFAAAGWSSPRVPGWGLRAAAGRVANPFPPHPFPASGIRLLLMKILFCSLEHNGSGACLISWANRSVFVAGSESSAQWSQPPLSLLHLPSLGRLLFELLVQTPFLFKLFFTGSSGVCFCRGNRG